MERTVCRGKYSFQAHCESGKQRNPFSFGANFRGLCLSIAYIAGMTSVDEESSMFRIGMYASTSFARLLYTMSSSQSRTNSRQALSPHAVTCFVLLYVMTESHTSHGPCCIWDEFIYLRCLTSRATLLCLCLDMRSFVLPCCNQASGCDLMPPCYPSKGSAQMEMMFLGYMMARTELGCVGVEEVARNIPRSNSTTVRVHYCMALLQRFARDFLTQKFSPSL